MCSICNFGNNISQPHPHPPLWYLKGLLLLCDLRQGFFFFDLPFLDKPLFLGLYLGIQFLGGAFFGALFHQFTLDGLLEDGFFHVLGEAAVEVLQFSPGLFIAVHQGQEFFDFGDDALLLGKRR